MEGWTCHLNWEWWLLLENIHSQVFANLLLSVVFLECDLSLLQHEHRPRTFIASVFRRSRNSNLCEPLIRLAELAFPNFYEFSWISTCRHLGDDILASCPSTSRVIKMAIDCSKLAYRQKLFGPTGTRLLWYYIYSSDLTRERRQTTGYLHWANVHWISPLLAWAGLWRISTANYSPMNLHISPTAEIPSWQIMSRTRSRCCGTIDKRRRIQTNVQSSKTASLERRNWRLFLYLRMHALNWSVCTFELGSYNYIWTVDTRFSEQTLTIWLQNFRGEYNLIGMDTSPSHFQFYRLSDQSQSQWTLLRLRRQLGASIAGGKKGSVSCWGELVSPPPRFHQWG